MQLQRATVTTIATKGNNLFYKNTLARVYDSFKEAFFSNKGITKDLIDNYRKLMITKFQVYAIEGGDGLREEQKETIHTFVKENADKFIA